MEQSDDGRAVLFTAALPEPVAASVLRVLAEDDPRSLLRLARVDRAARRLCRTTAASTDGDTVLERAADNALCDAEHGLRLFADGLADRRRPHKRDAMRCAVLCCAGAGACLRWVLAAAMARHPAHCRPNWLVDPRHLPPHTALCPVDGAPLPVAAVALLKFDSLLGTDASMVFQERALGALSLAAAKACLFSPEVQAEMRALVDARLGELRDPYTGDDARSLMRPLYRLGFYVLVKRLSCYPNHGGWTFVEKLYVGVSRR